jgi:hypothetical protein
LQKKKLVNGIIKKLLQSSNNYCTTRFNFKEKLFQIIFFVLGSVQNKTVFFPVNRLSLNVISNGGQSFLFEVQTNI